MLFKKQFQLGLCALLLTTAPAMANEKIVDAMIQMMKVTGDLEETAECFNKSEQEIEASMRSAFSYCIEKHGLNESAAGNQCMDEQFLKSRERLGITEADVARCGQEEEEYAYDQNDEDYYDQSGEFDEESYEEMKRRNRKAAQQMGNAMRNLRSAMEM